MNARPDGRADRRCMFAAFAAGLVGVLLAGISPAAAWHAPGAERWPYYDRYGARPYVTTPNRPPVARTKRVRPADPKRPALADLAKGQLHIVISINAQRLQVYSDGVAVAESPVSTGTASHPTPTGLFNVIQKNRFHRSNLYSDAPMPFMQRLTWSGIALHEGRLPGYPASHGCIRLPQAFAQELWGTTRLGTRVIITENEVAPVAVGHARLSALAPKPNDGVAARPPEASEPIKMAAASVTDAGAEEPLSARDHAMADGAGAVAAKHLPLRPGPVSVFVSRKEGKLYVRKGLAPIYSASVKIQDKDRPLGTHLFTALGSEGEALRWTVISLGDAAPLSRILEPEPRSRRGGRERATETRARPSTAAAAAALDRIEMPQEAIDFISELMSPGAALIVSDQGLGHETGLETDFIVVTQ